MTRKAIISALKLRIPRFISCPDEAQEHASGKYLEDIIGSSDRATRASFATRTHGH